MTRILKLQVEIPKIEMVDPFALPQDYWVPTNENALTFEIQEEKVEGVISLYLDPEGVELDWDTRDSVSVLEYPLACTRIAVLIEAQCDEVVTEKQFLGMHSD